VSNLRVIHIISGPDGGGAERLVRELTERLPDHGIESRAIYFCNPRGVGLTSSELCLGLNGARDFRAIVRLRHAVKQQLSEKASIIVHAHLTWPLYFVPFALAGLSVPLLYTEHNTENKRRRYQLLRRLERGVYSRYQQIACISQGTKESLDTWLGDDVSEGRRVVVHNGSRLLPFCSRARRAKPTENEVHLVSVGSLSRQKGFDIALRAVALLGDRVKRYTIVGEGMERDKLVDLAEELGIRGKLHLAGYVDDVTPYFHDADLALIPSRWEGFGLVAVEALSTGLPIVAADVAGMREVLVGCAAADLVLPQEPTSLAGGIASAIDRLVGNHQIALQARNHARQFSIDKMVKSYASLYERLYEECS
jgi:glycosyltransferase involved in cell wall biosynthesis